MMMIHMVRSSVPLTDIGGDDTAPAGRGFQDTIAGVLL